MKRNTNTKGSTTDTTDTAAAANERDLAELNRRFHAYEAAGDRLYKAYRRVFSEMDDKLCAARKSAGGAQAAFELWRKRMAGAGAETKFDCIGGEYFLAKDAGGKEVFAIRVQDVRSTMMHVAAKDADEAMGIATRLVAADPKLLEGEGLVAEDMSR